ncbi:adenylyl-sulfate kinase [Paludisphaera soli]|uniref:adenylyl-sulfate kinase n=1 Tax=Paludisphaera soli TaxID=2712865 RepID=UPI0013EA1E86|nr:adenylyl-sulfate kinase [Paludisphaera soli]
MDDLTPERPDEGRHAISAANESNGALITPYGGALVDLVVEEGRAVAMKAEAKDHPSVTLDERGVCDLELLAVGGFSPLRGFLGKADYERVVREQRLADGTFWPLPVVLPVTPGEGVAQGGTLALRDVYGNLLAFLHVEEIFRPDKEAEARHVYGALDAKHPSVAYLGRIPNHYAAGRLEVVRTPPHYDFVDLRRTPAKLRQHFRSLGWSRVVALHADEPVHRAQEEMARRAAEQIGGGLLIHPVVGVARPGDVEHYTHIRCYRALLDDGPGPGGPVLSLLPLSMRVAGPRETLLHAIVRRNFGCSHLIVGRDLASPGEATAEYADELGVGLVDARPMVYLPGRRRYEYVDAAPEGVETAALTDAQVRDEYLAKGRLLPDWFSRPAVAEILNEANPPRSRQGLTIWFTGLSGSGKSTVAHALVERLAEYGRNCSLLDGDEIRTHLSKGLGFSKEDRDANIRRVGYVAGLVAQHGGTTLCSVISPYKAVRDEARALSKGNFVEVYCSTPVDVCERRDVKGLYAQARAAVGAGKGMSFTGVDAPYEAPEGAEVTLDTSRLGVPECVDAIVEKLLALGYILPQRRIGA